MRGEPDITLRFCFGLCFLSITLSKTLAMITNSSLLKAPPRDQNDTRNLLIVILPTLLGILGLLGFIFLEVMVSKAFLNTCNTFWIQVLHSTNAGGLIPSGCIPR
ncbi:MAG: hypothetical protein RLZZ597_1498, partial [Cyanobacteriota bacterium]|jgi:hypothetical protein